MIQAIIRLQRCVTKARFAFVPKQQERHGIAAGGIRYYEVTARNWTQLRRIVADYDQNFTTAAVIGYSEVGPKTVEKHWAADHTDTPGIRLLGPDIPWGLREADHE